MGHWAFLVLQHSSEVRCSCASVTPQAPTVGTNGATSTEQVRIAVLGASGYTGEEVVRLLALHPNFSVAALTGESQAGKVSALHLQVRSSVFDTPRGWTQTSLSNRLLSLMLKAHTTSLFAC